MSRCGRGFNSVNEIELAAGLLRTLDAKRLVGTRRIAGNKGWIQHVSAGVRSG